MAASDPRLDRIEARLARIEQHLGIAAGTAASGDDAVAPPVRPRRTAALRRPSLEVDPTRLMAGGASLAFVLAAGYFVKLVYDAGWLTPERQIGLAIVAGLALIGGGLGLARVDRAYAAYMPAVGVVVLYLAIFAGHAFYHFFGLFPALGAVATITFTGVWLGRRFDHSAYPLIAVVGTYLTPLLIDAARADIVDLVVYFSAWGLLFSFVALQEARRSTYLLALFFALFGFDIAFRMTDESAWAMAAAYQFVQFVVFSATAVFFSVRHERPMRPAEALAHGLALFYFYAIEFIVLKQHAPGLAPWLALASVVIVVGLYRFARARMRDPDGIRAGALLASTYASVVTAHIVFLELMPDGWHAWAGLAFPIALALFHHRIGRIEGAIVPVLAVCGLLFSLAFLRALGAAEGGDEVVAPGLLLVLYSVALYGAYALFRRRAESFLSAPLPLYAGHLALLTASVRVLDGALAVSIAWAVTAIVLLLHAVRSQDRTVGQSSLVIFSASSLKVLLHDLSGTAPLIRVLVLVVLAASLYAGGWLYQQMARGREKLHPDPEVDGQLQIIRGLALDGLADDAIAAELDTRDVRRLDGAPAWDGEMVASIRRDYGFD